MKLCALAACVCGGPGTVPQASYWRFRFVLLQTLDLSNNSFSNVLPTVWSTLQQLVHLNISYNRFGGSLPLTWAALSNLQTLDMSNNTLQVR